MSHLDGRSDDSYRSCYLFGCRLTADMLQAVELCLRFGAKISSQQNDLSTPVHLACVQGSLEITQMLLDAQVSGRR